MTMRSEEQLRRRIKFWIVLFIVGLILSGVTAFPIETQLSIAANHMSWLPTFIHEWIVDVHKGVKEINSSYPFLSYGTDWLAFAHIVIAVAFIGPYRDPTKNIWVIQFGMIACVMVIPLALIAGHIREIPFYWRMIDCSFGIVGIIPLYICYKNIKKLEIIESYNSHV